MVSIVEELKQSWMPALFSFFRYVYSGLVVVFGIYLNLYSKNKASMDELFDRCLRKRQRGSLEYTQDIVWFDEILYAYYGAVMNLKAHMAWIGD